MRNPIDGQAVFQMQCHASCKRECKSLQSLMAAQVQAGVVASCDPLRLMDISIVRQLSLASPTPKLLLRRGQLRVQGHINALMVIILTKLPV